MYSHVTDRAGAADPSANKATPAQARTLAEALAAAFFDESGDRLGVGRSPKAAPTAE